MIGFLSMFSTLAGSAYAEEAKPAISEIRPTETELQAAIDAAYRALEAGPFDEAYPKLRQALLASARTGHYVFTINSYVKAADTLYQNGFSDEADEIFAEGEQTRAMRADIKERADFYLAYAQFRAAVPKVGTHFVPLFSAATELYGRYYGKESPELIHANDRLAMALAESGQVGTAVNLAQGNYDLALKVLGSDDPFTWRLTNNLAETLRLLGAPARALSYDEAILQKRMAHYGKSHMNTLVSANNAGLDCLQLGNYLEALRYFQLNREIALTLTNDPILLAQADIWILYAKLLAGTEKLDDKGLAEIEKVIDDPAYPELLSFKAANLLADHFERTGNHERSLRYLEQAYAISRSGNYPDNSLSYASRLALAKAKSRVDPAGAASDFAKLDQDLTPWLSMQIGFAGNRDVAEATRAMADDMLYDYGRLAEIEPAAVASFADAIRRWPSLEDGKRDRLRKLARLVGDDDAIMQDMIHESMRIAFTYREVFAVDQSEQSPGWAMLERLRELDAEINRRANERYHLSAESMEAPLPTPSELLQPDQALVQYFITRKWRADRDSLDPFLETRLYAIVWRSSKQPHLYYLGDPRDIVSQTQARQIASLRSSRERRERGAVPVDTLQDTFASLDSRLIAPLQGDLIGAKTLFVIPDGQLFAVPFSLLQDSQKQLLEQRYTTRMLTRPESLYSVTAQQILPKGGDAFLAGGLNYSNGAEKGAESLPGTLKEVNEIAEILKGRHFALKVLVGGEASEPAVRTAMEHTDIAHLATHGAYASPKTGGQQGVDALWQSDVILSRSGDKRAMRRDETDGRLYAFELMTWNLSGLDLLVLSACETGRGEETFVGGLRGLPTAAGIAGAKRSLLTLWPVADEGTAQFMVRFYQHLTGGKTYPEALRQTRLDAIAGKLPAAKDPRVWAAFVMFEN